MARFIIGYVAVLLIIGLCLWLWNRENKRKKFHKDNQEVKNTRYPK